MSDILKERTVVESFSTFFKIRLAPADMRFALNMMSSLNATSFKGDIIPLGYQFDYANKVLKIHKGCGLPFIYKHFTNGFDLVQKEAMPYITFKGDFEINKKPFSYQEEILNIANETYSRKTDNLLVCNLPTGRGKSVTSIFMAKALKTPFIIIVKNESIRAPWIKSFMKSTNLKMGDDIYEISGMKGLNYIMSMSKPHRGYIVKHASIRAIINEVGYIGLNKMLMKAGIGFKIIDEFDTEFSSIIDIDLNTGIKYNLYLTATVYKNDKSEDRVFQKTFTTVLRTGKEYFPDYKPNRDCEFVYFKSYPNPKDRFCVFNAVNNFSSYLYNDYLFDKKTEMMIDLITPYIDKFKKEFPAQSKICIYVEKKESCRKMAFILVKRFGVDMKDISIINDEVVNKDYSKKWFVSTGKSMGRGIDVDNLDFGINLENYAGLSILEQQTGRFGRVGNPQKGFFVNFVDCSYKYIIQYNKSKLDKLDELFDNHTLLYYDTKEKKYLNSMRELMGDD